MGRLGSLNCINKQTAYAELHLRPYGQFRVASATERQFDNSDD